MKQHKQEVIERAKRIRKIRIDRENLEWYETNEKWWDDFRKREIQKAFDDFFTAIEAKCEIKNTKHPKVF